MFTGVRAGLPWRPWCAVSLAHAVVSELVQHWVLPHRSGDPRDALADAIGVLLATLLVTRLHGGSEEGRNPPSGVGDPTDGVPRARE
jgi:hypothetical protein